MPAVVILPAVAGFAAGSMVTAGMFGMSLLTTTIVAGAVAGAVVGGLTAAITGGDIGEGILFGAVGGAVGGVLGGAYNAGSFGELAKGSFAEGLFGSGGAGDVPTLLADPSMKAAGPGATSEMISAAANANVGLTSTPAAVSGGTSSNDMLTYALVSGGAEMFKQSPEVPYSTTKEGVTQSLDTQSSIYEAKNETDLEAARIAAAQRQREAELAYKSNAEGLAFKDTELKQTLAQRQAELMTPYQEAAASRERATATATGLSAQRRAVEAAQNPDLLA